METGYMWSYEQHRELAFATFVAGLGFVRGFALRDAQDEAKRDEWRLPREKPQFYDDYQLPPGKSLMWALAYTQNGTFSS
jgi:hypothetical protein